MAPGSMTNQQRRLLQSCKTVTPILLLAASVVIGACTAAEPAPVEAETGGSPQRIIALGDSYTAGTAIAEGTAWPYRLTERIQASGSDASLAVVAGEGWNTKRLHREIIKSELPDDPTDVVLAIGANDVVLNFGVKNFLEGLALLERDINAMATEQTDLFVLSIPDFRVSPWGVERAERNYPIELYNELLSEFAGDLGATYIDITTSSQRALGTPDLIADDDLHFSSTMHDEWAFIVYREMATP